MYKYLEDGEPQQVMTYEPEEPFPVPVDQVPQYDPLPPPTAAPVGPPAADDPLAYSSSSLAQYQLNKAPPTQMLSLNALDAPADPIISPVIQDTPTMGTIPNRGGNLPAPATPPANYTNDIAALRAQVAQMPVRKAPNWIERIGAGALGGAAGWSNAASRTRNPIDIGAATQGILYPGYQGRLAEWQSRVAPLEKAAEISGQQAAAQWKAQQIQSEEQLKQAQAKGWLDRGESQLLNAQRQRGNPWRKQPDGSYFNEQTGESRAATVSGKDAREARYQEALGRFGGDKTKLTPEQKQDIDAYTYNNKWPDHAERNPNEWDLRSLAANGDKAAAQMLKDRADEEIRVKNATRDLFSDLYKKDLLDRKNREDAAAVNNKKLDELQRIEQNRLQKVHNAQSAQNYTPDQRQTEIDGANNAALQATKQTQDNYSRQIVNAGGSADQQYDYTVDTRNGVQWHLRAPVQPQQPQQPTQPQGKAGSSPRLPSGPPSQPQAPSDNEKVHANIPDGKGGKVLKVFPNKKALEDYGKAAHLTFSDEK